MPYIRMDSKLLASDTTMWRILVLLMFASDAYSDSCITYSFEENYNELFTTDLGVCASALPLWDIETYDNKNLTSPHEFSTQFIYPHQDFSCVSSFMFSVTAGGVVEANIYMDSSFGGDSVQVLVMQYTSDGQDNVVGQAYSSPSQGDFFESGWHTMRMTIAGTGTFTAYISIMGMAIPSSILLVDSFRYIPPSIDESECVIYKQQPSTTTESITTTEFITVPTTTAIVTDPTENEVITESTTAEINTVPTTEAHNDSTTEVVETTTTTEATVEQSTTDATTNVIQTTEVPTNLPESDDTDDTFWTQLRIILLVLISLLMLLLLCSCCYCCRRSNPTVVVVKA